MGASYGKRKDAKRGKIHGRFTPLLHNIVKSTEYRRLNHAARSLLIDIAVQYNGSNNGKLVACSKYLKPLGWSSHDTISRSLRELEKGGFLIKTRQGMRPPMAQPTWYALGWLGLDVTEGLDANPKAYRLSVFTPITTLALNKMITPLSGTLLSSISPITGTETPHAAPINGLVGSQTENMANPASGEFIYSPSAPANYAGQTFKVIH